MSPGFSTVNPINVLFPPKKVRKLSEVNQLIKFYLHRAYFFNILDTIHANIKFMQVPN